ncbi:MAG: AMP-binding protein, partial [Caulobacteraceae bacterium]
MNLKALRPANVEPLFCDYFDLNVRWRGGRRAVMFEGATLLWRELGGRCYQVANRLGYLGLGPGDAVVVLLENRLETAEIVLGVIRSGACLVPINLTISDDAVLRQIADCAAAAIFASREEALRVTAATAELGVERRVAVGASLEGWSEFEDWREGSKSEAPDRVPEPDHALTVVYSSGTTGVPKGIVHTHLTRTRNMLDIGRILRLSEDTVWIASLGFYSNAAILPFLI